MTTEIVEQGHKCFQELTGRDLMLHPEREMHWKAFFARFTIADLGLVVRHLRKRIKDGKAYEPQLWFANLIANLGKFEEHLNDAKRAKVDVNEKLKPAPAKCLTYPPYGVSGDRVKYHLEQMRKAAG